MAGSNVLREFLIALGFDIDEKQFRDFDTRVTRITKELYEAGKVAAIAGLEISAALIKTATDMERLYYVSQRTGSSVGNLQAFAYGASQIGVDADTATAAVEGLAASLRINPANAIYFQQLGIKQTGDSVQNLLNLVQRLKQLGPPGTMGYSLGAQIAGQFGIDEKTLFMLEKNLPQLMQMARQQKQSTAAAGIDPQKLAEESHQFMQDFRELTKDFHILEMGFLGALLPYADAFVKKLDQALKVAIELNKQTGGKSTAVGGIIGAIGGGIIAKSILGAGARALGLGGGAAATGGAGLATGGLALFDTILGLKVGSEAYQLYQSYKQSQAGGSAGSGLEAQAPPYWRPLFEGLKKLERFASRAYKDASGYSIGYGHQIRPGENFAGGIDQATASRLLAQDMAKALGEVAKDVKVNLTNNQRQALADLVFNIGGSAFEKSTLLRLLNSGDVQGAADQFSRWNKVNVNGAYQASAALTQRRLGERALFMKPDVTVHQETNIHVNGSSSPQATADGIANQQKRVNGDLVRNLQSTVQ